MLRLQNNDTLRFLDLQNVEKLKVITVPHSSINYFTWLTDQARVLYCSLCCNWSYMLLHVPTHPDKYQALLSCRKNTTNEQNEKEQTLIFHDLSEV